MDDGRGAAPSADHAWIAAVIVPVSDDAIDEDSGTAFVPAGTRGQVEAIYCANCLLAYDVAAGTSCSGEPDLSATP